MPNLNKVMLMGNLTRDPELRYTPSNTAVANIGIAVNRRWRNAQTGEQQEETTFVDCEAWSRTAETINQYLRKGRPIFIEGRLKLDQWQDPNGNNRSKLKVVIETFQFVDSRGGSGDTVNRVGTGDSADRGGAGGTQDRGSAAGDAAGERRTAGAATGKNEAYQPVEGEDIPF